MKGTNTAIFNNTDSKPCPINNSQKSLNCMAYCAEILLGIKSFNAHFYYWSFTGKIQSAFICTEAIIKTGTRAFQQGNTPENRNSPTIYKAALLSGAFVLGKDLGNFHQEQVK